MTERFQFDTLQQEYLLSSEEDRLLDDQYKFLIISDLQGQLVGNMEVWAALTGLNCEDICGDGWLESIHPDDRHRLKQSWFEACNTVTPFREKYRVMHRNGNYRNMLTHAVPRKTETGLLEWTMSCLDITTRMRSNHALNILVEASEILDRAPKPELNLEALTEYLTPRFADSVTIYTTYDTGTLNRVATHSRNEAFALKLNELELFTRSQTVDKVWPQLRQSLSNRKPMFIPDMKFYLSFNWNPRPILPQMMFDAGIRSAIIMPLVTGENYLGLMTIFNQQGRDPFDTTDMYVARELARRVALTIRNARLSRESLSAERRLESQLNFIRAITDSIGEGVFVMERSGTLTFLNPAAERALGWTLDELRGRNAHDVFHYQDADGNPIPFEKCVLQEVFRTGNIMVRDGDTYTHKNGTMFPVFSTNAPLFQDGEVVAAVVAFRDISERIRDEAIIRERARQQAAVASLGRSALSGANLTTLLNETVNLLAQTLSVECTNVFELLPGGNELLLRAGVGWKSGRVGRTIIRPIPTTHIDYSLRTNQPVILHNMQNEALHNRERLLHEHNLKSGLSVIIPGLNRAPFGLLGAYTTRLRTFSEDDIHFMQSMAHMLSLAIERKEVEDSIRHLNEELEQRVLEQTQEVRRNERLAMAGETAAMAAHEIRNPLAAVKGFIQLTLRHPERYEDYLTISLKEVRRIKTLLNDFLLLAKPGAMERKAVQVDPLLNEVVETLRLTSPSSSVHIELKTEECWVLGDSMKLREVLLNIGANALEALGGESGVVRFNLRTHQGNDQQVEIIIWNSGPPFPESDLENVFEPFYSTKDQGTGLGLAISRRIILDHGGTIRAFNDEEGGAYLQILLPRLQPPHSFEDTPMQKEVVQTLQTDHLALQEAAAATEDADEDTDRLSDGVGTPEDGAN